MNVYRLLSCQTQEIGPKRADSLLKLNVFEGQRPRSILYENLYAEEMLDGRFRIAEIAVAICPKGTPIKRGAERLVCASGEHVLMNGQTTLEACKKANKKMTTSLAYYTCEQVDDVWHLFGTFDVHRCRTERHVMGAARGLFHDARLQTVPIDVLARAGSALFFLGDGLQPSFTTSIIEKTVKPDLVQNHVQDVLFLAQYAARDYRHIHRIGVATAMIATHRANESAAQAFWDRIAIGDQLERGTPQLKLHHALTNNKIANIGQRVNQAYYCLCVAWWNAWRTKQVRRTVKVAAMKEIPPIHL